MTDKLRRDYLDVAAMHRRLGPQWSKPRGWGEDAWFLFGPVGKKIIVSYDPDSEPGVGWVHASVSYELSGQPIVRYPSYSDLTELHRGVFGGGYAYQCFVPPDAHISITGNVLHLWGRLDGAPALPDFGKFGTI